MGRKWLVYVAGPLTVGNTWLNIRLAVLAAADLRLDGFAVHVPHLSIIADMVDPQPYDVWLANDLALLERCDLVYRLPGVSPGADREVAHAEAHGIPVVYSLEDALDWRESQIIKAPPHDD